MDKQQEIEEKKAVDPVFSEKVHRKEDISAVELTVAVELFNGGRIRPKIIDVKEVCVSDEK